jgi:hypothetical protein
MIKLKRYHYNMLQNVGVDNDQISLPFLYFAANKSKKMPVDLCTVVIPGDMTISI